MPGDVDFDMSVSGANAASRRPSPVREVLQSGAQEVADPVLRIVFAASVAVDVLLDPAADLIDGSGPELDHVERVMPTSA